MKIEAPSGDLKRDLANGRQVRLSRGEKCKLEVRADVDASREIDFIASTAGIKRDGHEVIASGLCFDNYEKNPVFLWGHDQGDIGSPPQPPIGSVVKHWIDKDGRGADRLNIRVRFAKHDFANTIFELYRDKHMTSVSISWTPIKTEPIDTGVRFLEGEMLEISAVPIPADPEAVMRKIREVANELGGVDLADEFSRAVRTSPHYGYVLDSRDALTKNRLNPVGSEGSTMDEDKVEESVKEKRELPEDAPEGAVVCPECNGAGCLDCEEKGYIMPESDEVEDEAADEAVAVEEERTEDTEDAETREVGDEDEDDAAGRGGLDGEANVEENELQPLIAGSLAFAESVEDLAKATAEEGDINAALGQVAESVDAVWNMVRDLIGVETEEEVEETAVEEEERSAAQILTSLLDDAESRIGKKISKKRFENLSKAKDCMREAADMIDSVMTDAVDAERSAPKPEEKDANVEDDVDALARLLGIDEVPNEEAETEIDALARMLFVEDETQGE